MNQTFYTAVGTDGQVWKASSPYGNRIYFSKLGDIMTYGETLVCEGSKESPVQQNIRQLQADIQNKVQQIKHIQQCLLISRVQLAAVKKLVK